MKQKVVHISLKCHTIIGLSSSSYVYQTYQYTFVILTTRKVVKCSESKLQV